MFHITLCFTHTHTYTHTHTRIHTINTTHIHTHTNKRHNTTQCITYTHHTQHFRDADSDPKRFTLPLFGSLARASSENHVGEDRQNRPSTFSSSFSNSLSVNNLSVSPPVSPSKPPFMPQLTRKQRRASLVSGVMGLLSSFAQI